jgi:hypothetical protein
LITGLELKNLNVKNLTIIDFPSNIFLIPHGIYYKNNTLYVINHAFYSGGSDRIEVFKLI